MKNFSNILKIITFAIILILALSVKSFAATKAANIRQGNKLKFTGYAWTVYKTSDGAVNLSNNKITRYIKNNEVIAVQSVKTINSTRVILKIGKNEFISFGKSAEPYFVITDKTVYRTIKYEIKLGDINGDNKVDSADNRLISRYLSGLEKFDIDKMIRADMNKDNKVNAADARELARNIFNTPTVRKISFVPGDLDSDGRVTAADSRLIQRYFNGLESFTMLQNLAADVDGDKQVTSADWRLITLRTVDKITEFPVDGDLDFSGAIDAADTRLVLRYLSGLEKLNAKQKNCADIDKDGEVTAIDQRTLFRRLSGLE